VKIRIEMKKYLVVIEETETGFSAYSPDLPGCIATGTTREEVEREIREAIEFHLDGMKQEGMEIPAPHSYSTYCEEPA
jgi:predicted RNase H-like HicB family nuclease